MTDALEALAVLRGRLEQAERERDIVTTMAEAFHGAARSAEASVVSLKEALREAKRIVAEAEPALSSPPIDCTNHCGNGRVQAWNINLIGLRAALASSEEGDE